jgi:hypothetical protein
VTAEEYEYAARIEALKEAVKLAVVERIYVRDIEKYADQFYTQLVK